MKGLFVFATFFIVPVVANSGPDVLCVYPLSGMYTPFQRILFYVLLVFGVIGRRQRWLVAGALASAMTYCGAAAIHSFFLIAKARSSSVDLDVYGVFAVTSTGIMLTAPLLAWSTTLQTVEKEIRTLILLWTILIMVGAILSTTSIYIRGSVGDPACVRSPADIASAVSSLQSPSDDCTYVCFAEEYPLSRSPGDIRAWRNQLDAPSEITAVFVPTISASIVSSIITWVWVIRRGRVHLLRPPPVFNRFELGWIGEWLFGRGRRDQIPSVRMSSSDEVRHPKVVQVYQYYLILSSFGVFVVNLVLNEVRFRYLPINEMPYEVGQWSPWVGVGLILLAQFLSHLFRRIRSQSQKSKAEDEEDLRIWVRQGNQDEKEWTKEMKLRRSTYCSKTSTGRRRHSF